MTILVLNAGSSTLKFAVFAADTANLQRVLSGRIEAGEPHCRLVWQPPGADSPVSETLPLSYSPEMAVEQVLTKLDTLGLAQSLTAVGHRIVHGGARFSGPVELTADVRQAIAALTELAPLHQPAGLSGIDAIARVAPQLRQVACFDTAFHRGREAVTELLPLPAALRAKGLRRYGFHGLSYEAVIGKLQQLSPATAGGRVVIAHLGSGASLCALRHGLSVDTTMGFSTLDGLCMGTRPGSLDAGALLHLLRRGLSADALEDLLYRQSGLLGLSGHSADMRTLLNSDTASDQQAIDYFVYRINRELGGMVATLGGIDALVFTGGIGERAGIIRERVCSAAQWLDIQLDPEANAHNALRLNDPDSRVEVWCIPTDEEAVIAAHTARVIGAD